MGAARVNVLKDLYELYEAHGFRPGPRYTEIISKALGPYLSFGSAAMYGITATVLGSKKMIAYNLVQNSIDEAKGAARIQLIADRYAKPDLFKLMKRHVGEELKHSTQFNDLVGSTGYTTEQLLDPNEVADVMDFEDDLYSFICRVHSIEVRSWTVLRIYQDVLGERRYPEISETCIPVIDDIMQDEINHVVYTGKTLDGWLQTNENPQLPEILEECFSHTDRETWQDMANMTRYLADNYLIALHQGDPTVAPPAMGVAKGIASPN